MRRKTHLCRHCETQPRCEESHGLCTGCKSKEDVAYYSKNSEKVKERVRRNYSTEYEFARCLRRYYNLTVDQYNDMVEKQNGLCAICNQPPKKTHSRNQRLYIDHNHATKQNRALLCDSCNFLIGHAEENLATLLSAIEYLKQHQM